MSLLGDAAGALTGNIGLYVAGGLLAAGVAAFGIQTWRLHDAQTATAQAHQQLSDERAAAAKVALAATTANRTEDNRRTAAQREIVDETQRIAARARADGVVADAAHGRLSDRADAVARRCAAAGDPAPAVGGPPAPDAGHLLADVLKRADERAGQLAAYADEARAAGSACERAYDSLTSGPAIGPGA